MADTKTAVAHKIAGVAVNSILGNAVQWMPDQRTLLVQRVPVGRGKPPADPVVPPGPNVLENIGKAARAILRFCNLAIITIVCFMCKIYCSISALTEQEE